MYSVVETAKANKANVLAYLKYLLEEMPKHKGDSSREYLADMTPLSDKYRQYEADYLLNSRKLCQNFFVEPEKPKAPTKRSKNATQNRPSA